MQLNIWEGDKVFFRLIDMDAPFFSLKLEYDEKDNLVRAVLDGREMNVQAAIHDGQCVVE